MAEHNIAGSKAEKAVAEYLQKLGYKILDTNWKTRWCEIDIIAEKNGCVYFVEVKYRRSDDYGSGLEYITPGKLRQMQFAAQFWISSNKSYDEYTLSAAEVSGPDYKIEFIEEL